MVDDSEDIKMGFQLGQLAVRKRHSKRKSIDWAATTKVGKLCFHTNMHTRGWHVTFRWLKNRSRFRVREVRQYEFIPCRAATRKVSYAFSHGTDYFI